MTIYLYWRTVTLITSHALNIRRRRVTCKSAACKIEWEYIFFLSGLVTFYKGGHYIVYLGSVWHARPFTALSHGDFILFKYSVSYGVGSTTYNNTLVQQEKRQPWDHRNLHWSSEDQRSQEIISTTTRHANVQCSRYSIATQLRRQHTRTESNEAF